MKQPHSPQITAKGTITVAANSHTLQKGKIVNINKLQV